MFDGPAVCGRQCQRVQIFVRDPSPLPIRMEFRDRSAFVHPQKDSAVGDRGAQFVDAASHTELARIR